MAQQLRSRTKGQENMQGHGHQERVTYSYKSDQHVQIGNGPVLLAGARLYEQPFSRGIGNGLGSGINKSAIQSSLLDADLLKSTQARGKYRLETYPEGENKDSRNRCLPKSGYSPAAKWFCGEIGSFTKRVDELGSC